ncbi:MAG: guanylate kinase [Deltaproteobacteria bacterium]|nr:guanylate kinase [Deltaproteobacteria bacterium]
MRAGRLIVVSAPSGVGKSTVCQRLRDRHAELAISVSFTTRCPRGRERDGVEYHFVEEATFDRMIAAGAFLEWADVHGARYGTAREDVERLLADGKDVLFDIDVQGGRQIKSARPDALLVFLLPPSVEEWVRRLRGRATETPDEIERRLRAGVQELEAGRRYDRLVVNGDLDSTIEELEDLCCGEDRSGPAAHTALLDGLLFEARRMLS